MLYLDQIKEATSALRMAGVTRGEIGVVLGTGLSRFIDHINVVKCIPYTDIPHFPVATVEYHAGNLIYGTIGSTSVICMQGRFHYYEGYSMQQITFPIRVMHELGIKTLLLSNAAGGLELTHEKGDLVIIDDHINLLPDNPLRGLNDNAYGPRFPDMSRPYDKDINNAIRDAAKLQGIKMKRGVYAAVQGPNLETASEYRYLKLIGADIVGMSTVPEVIVANQLRLPCAAVSVITDVCDPEDLHPVDISDIIEVAGRADGHLSKIFADAIRSIALKMPRRL